MTSNICQPRKSTIDCGVYVYYNMFTSYYKTWVDVFTIQRILLIDTIFGCII